MIDYVLNNNILPDASSLIVSYPLCHTENDSYVETFTKFFAFERPVKRKIMEAVRESISKILVNKKEKLYEKFQIDNIEERLAVKTVVNDSVASYFSSKLRSYDFSISIILGTGTNAAFNIKYQDEKYVLNSEWGSFTPKSIEFWEKEIEIFKKMEELYNKNVNFLDVIAANGCKFDLINILLPPDHEKITKENYKDVIENPSDLRAKIYKIVMERSKQIIAALTLAAIRNSNKKSCLIVTNGSGFDNPKDSEAFKEIFDDLIQNVIIMGDDFEVEFLHEEGLTLIGSALYTLHRIIY
ncbi:Hexokinase-2 [Nosema bombycis CQ1]|uniref:Hexokinase-2 n=1 Tax=Nosema bombycis (strain CQ1 / CVCC 102059) TaxID=578461 RepID=R0KUE7_NOSB1|nr:Hexokinase-2 [Nosema bombycis CQ1]|eukprot:EOB14451.1 Hexokinase-2 [Nosema bombycis CQ1]